MKTVIEMAKKAGIRDVRIEVSNGQLERFAALVREDERERNGRGDYMEGLEEGYAAGQRDEREKQQEPLPDYLDPPRYPKQQEPVAEVFYSYDVTELGGNKPTGKTILPYKSIDTLKIGTKLYTTTPTAAQAARQMRDAAVKLLHKMKFASFPEIGKARKELEQAIAALPVPEVQWRDLTDGEIKEIVNDCTSDDHGYDIWCDGDSVARAVIAKFKEKQL